jgi:hypothetical protein
MSGTNRTLGTGPAAVRAPRTPAPAAATNISRKTAAVNAVKTAAVFGTGIGAYVAFQGAADLYNRRESAADLFQNQLQFPEDLIQSNRRFYMGFNFMKYQKRSIENSPFLRLEGSVRLPLPEGLRDNLSLGYTPADLGPAVGAALDAAAATQNGGRALFSQENVSAVAQGIGVGVAQNLINQNTGLQTAAQGLQAFLGMAVNPYQTILFEKPEFKTHNFSWKIMPKSEKESDEARKIYKTFQYHASPGISSGPGLFFSYPSMVIVNLYPSSDFLYRFKPCVIRSVSVNYAGAGAPSFFKRTDAPTAMTLSIQLQEIEYWTANDYRNVDDVLEGLRFGLSRRG